MIRSCPRNHPAGVAPPTPSFILFKPLVAIASLTIMFELLPIDFQHWIAPSLVSGDAVFWAGHEPDLPSATVQQPVDDSCILDANSYFSPQPLGTSL